jgi:hypothetical protein
MALRPAVSQAILRAYERRLFRRAAAVVLNTEAARDCYAEAYAGDIPTERFHFVRNAFDEGLFDTAPELPPDPVFTVMYFGTFRLFVEPEGLLRAFKRFVDDHAVAPGTARLRFVGGLRAEDHTRIAEMGLTPFVDAVKSVPFRKSVGLLRQADVLSLVIQPDCTLQIPGKLYDYLGARRFILALSANTEVNGLLDRTGAGAGIPWAKRPPPPPYWGACTRRNARRAGSNSGRTSTSSPSAPGPRPAPWPPSTRGRCAPARETMSVAAPRRPPVRRRRPGPRRRSGSRWPI